MSELDAIPEERKQEIINRKHQAIDKDKTIVFVVKQDESKQIGCLTLENPWILSVYDTEAKAVTAAFANYLKQKYNIEIELKQSSGDPEVSQLTTSKS